MKKLIDDRTSELDDMIARNLESGVKIPDLTQKTPKRMQSRTKATTGEFTVDNTSMPVTREPTSKQASRTDLIDAGEFSLKDSPPQRQRMSRTFDRPQPVSKSIKDNQLAVQLM